MSIILKGSQVRFVSEMKLSAKVATVNGMASEVS